MSIFDRPLRQPDQRSCGASVLVVARMLSDPEYADRILDDPDRFGQEVLAVHERTTGSVTANGALQLPWPRALGTPPWAVAHELTARTGREHRSHAVLPWDREGALAAIRGATAAGHPVPLYIGSRWLPRHVVLVLDTGLRTYDPSRGRVGTLDAAQFTAGELDLARWPVPWFTVLPVRRTRA